MPIYEYQCEQCEHVFEEWQKDFSERSVECPKCGAPSQRLISNTAFILKGSGWYVTDYARNGKNGGSNGTAKPDAKSNAKTDAKTETKSDAKDASASKAKDSASSTSSTSSSASSAGNTTSSS